MFYFIRFLIDLIYVVALCVGYKMGQVIGMPLMFTDAYVAQLFCGLMGITAVAGIFSVLKGTVLFLLKAIGLYAIATNTPTGEAFKGTMKHLGKIIGVASVTKLITEAVEDVKNAMMDGESGTSITKIFPILEVLPFSGLIKVAGKYYAKSFTYLDECILAYSFALDKPLMESVKDAFTQFLKQSTKIVGRLAMSNVAVSVINTLIFIIGFMLVFTKVDFGILQLVIFYIGIRAVMYILDDAFIQPMLLKQVITDYVSSIETDTAASEFQKDMNALNSSVDTGDASADETPANGDAEEALSAELNRLFELPAVKRLMQMQDTKTTAKGTKDE